jgi:two-component system C4-dicarboxylate transport response regulator DctD
MSGSLSSPAEADPAQRVLRPILVVDDDAVFRTVVAAMLQRHGHAFSTCPDADEAVAEAARIGPALLVTDLNMPGRDGLELFAELRRRDPFLRGILVSTSLDGELLVRVAESGIHDAIPKPLHDHYRLVEAVERQLYEWRRWRAILRDLKRVGR